MGLILQFHLTDSNRAFTCILLVSFEFESSPSFSRLKYCVVGMDLALPLYPGDDKIHATRATRGGAGNSLSAAREADVYSS